MLGYLITLKPVRTSKGEGMFFGTFIDAAGNWLETVHFPASAKNFPLHGHGFYRISGIVMNEFGAYSVNVGHMIKVAVKAKGDPDFEDVIQPVESIKPETYTLEQLSALRMKMNVIIGNDEDNDALLKTSFAA
jgi:hypothetical protein